MTQVTESDYRKAQQFGGRQEFIDAIDLGDLGKLVNRRVYVPFTRKEDEPHLMTLTAQIDLKDFNLEGTVLKVFKRAFEEQFYFFMNCMLLHEGHHARQYQGRECRVFGTDILKAHNDELFSYRSNVVEIPAYLNQLTAKSNFPLRWLDRVRYYLHLQGLDSSMKSQAKKFGQDWKKDLSKVLCPSPYDDIVRERYGVD